MSNESPVVMIRYSDDGGRTWSSEAWFNLGKDGDYHKRIELHQQGAAFQRIYDVTFSDERSFTIISGYADIQAAI